MRATLHKIRKTANFIDTLAVFSVSSRVGLAHHRKIPLSVTVCNLFSSSPARKVWLFSHFGKLTFLISSSHSILCSDTILIRFAPLSPLHSMRSIQLRNKLSYFLRFGKWFVRLLRFILWFCNAWT